MESYKISSHSNTSILLRRECSPVFAPFLKADKVKWHIMALWATLNIGIGVKLKKKRRKTFTMEKGEKQGFICENEKLQQFICQEEQFATLQ
jgi:hypothetical protein